MNKHLYKNLYSFDVNRDDPEGAEIWSVFSGKCFICTKPAKTIHEIIPRGRGQDSMDKKNRAPICGECHEGIHAKGISPSDVAFLQEKRRGYLISIGREDYA